jgi:transposase
MAENSIPLTRKQTKAISALLACQTIAEAAEMAGVSDRTIYRWIEMPEFRGALRTAAHETIGETVRRLAAGRDEALNTLYRLMTGAERESDQRLAAATWLQVDRDTQRLEEIEQRLTVLEAEVSNGKHN